MKSTKGQALVAVVFLFSLVMLGAIMILFFLVSATGDLGNRFTGDVSTEIQYKMEEVSKRSVVAITMNDHLWRHPDIWNGKFNQSLATKLTSYYYGTPGDKIYINGTSFSTSEIKHNLTSYYKFKMEKYLRGGASSVPYYFEISGGEGEDIVVRTEDYQPEVTESAQRYPIAIPGGETVEAKLWTGSSDSRYGVNPE